MPRSVSTVIGPHRLGPARSFVAPAGHVSAPGSPGCGIVWKRQTTLPVWTSKARASPLGPTLTVSCVLGPTITRSLYIAGGDVTAYAVVAGKVSATPVRRLIVPLSPNPAAGLPVLASSAIRRPSEVP